MKSSEPLDVCVDQSLEKLLQEHDEINDTLIRRYFLEMTLQLLDPIYSHFKEQQNDLKVLNVT